MVQQFDFLVIGSGIAGAFSVMTSSTANSIGVGGLPGILSMQPQSMGTFAIAMLIAIAVPFVLTVIIGKRTKYVSQADALDHVAGYTVTNDVSERGFQLERSGQWTKGKSCDNFGQIGPWLVTPDEVADPQQLAMWLRVNDTTMQDGSTATMVYGVAFLIHYLSQFMTLHPGDIISTGTPPGVGMGQVPPRYLRAGDVIELGIEGLGQQRQKVIAD